MNKVKTALKHTGIFMGRVCIAIVELEKRKKEDIKNTTERIQHLDALKKEEEAKLARLNGTN